MPIPDNINIEWIAYALIVSGLFLFISGLNIIKIEKVTIKPGLKTWIIGLVFVIIGVFMVIEDTPKNEFFYVCYDNKIFTDETAHFVNCKQTTQSCISMKKNLKQFGRYTSEKDSFMALERCKLDSPQ